MSKNARLNAVHGENQVMTEQAPPSVSGGKSPIRHHIIVRLCHWLGAASMICMILSGWQIYNASPLLPFIFPHAVTLGGWLGGAIAWHLTAMWGLLLSGSIYLVFGVISGHFYRDLRLRSPHAVLREIKDALSLRLSHETSDYNAVQRLFYAGVIGASILAVLTGLAIWKPVQLEPLTALFGDYPLARKIHFAMMVVIASFLLVHLTLVAIVPRTLRAMITGKEGVFK
jgi:thiosulfate reductase cytochrome b subunit